MKPSEYSEHFNTINVLFFVELEPLSGCFEQICLTDKSVKKVLDAIENELPHRDGGFDVTTNPQTHIHLENTKDCYTQEEINKLSTDDVDGTVT